MVTEVEESMPSIDWVGPRSCLRISVARMEVILRLRRATHIGQMERDPGPDPLPGRPRVLAGYGPGDLQGFPAGFEAHDQAVLLPDERGSGHQRVLLAHYPVLVDVEVGMPAADRGAGVVVDPHAPHLGAHVGELLQVLAADAAGGLREDQPGADAAELRQPLPRRVDQRDALTGDAYAVGSAER